MNICGHEITGSDYGLRMMLSNFCYYLKEQGITKLGREDSDAGFIESDKVRLAIDKFLEENK